MSRDNASPSTGTSSNKCSLYCTSVPVNNSCGTGKRYVFSAPECWILAAGEAALCACGRGKVQHLALHSWTSSGMNGLQSARNNLHTPGPHTVHTDGNSLLQREVVCAIHTDVAVASCTHPRAVSDTSLTHATVVRVVCERVGQLKESLLGFWVEAARPLPLWAGFRRKTSTLSDLPKIQLHAIHGCKF